MNERGPKEEYEEAHQASPFIEGMAELLPGIPFYEIPELAEIRTVALETLQAKDHDPTLDRAIWEDYSRIWESIVEHIDVDKTSLSRARLQIAAIVHKALIFYAARDMERYVVELREAAQYAYATAHHGELTSVAAALWEEIDWIEQG